MLAFYMDHNVHAALVHGLRLRGVDVLTAVEDGRSRECDPQLLARAHELARVLVTHDQDFHAIAAEHQRSGEEFSGVIFIVQEGLRIGAVIEYLHILAEALSPDELRNRVELIP
jgi:hypothetical protein